MIKYKGYTIIYLGLNRYRVQCDIFQADITCKEGIRGILDIIDAHTVAEWGF